MSDYSMLDLFRQEVATQVGSLKQSLSILKQQPSQVSEIETAMRSLAAIAGSAQIVEIDVAANLAVAMTDLLAWCDRSTLQLTQTQIDSLLYALDLLVAISNVEDLEGWLVAHTQDLSSTHAAISSAIADTAQQPSLKTDAGRGCY